VILTRYLPSAGKQLLLLQRVSLHLAFALGLDPVNKQLMQENDGTALAS
jgi:hypothetical protein